MHNNGEQETQWRVKRWHRESCHKNRCILENAPSPKNGTKRIGIAKKRRHSLVLNHEKKERVARNSDSFSAAQDSHYFHSLCTHDTKRKPNSKADNVLP